jgi:hypothetical protein
MLKKVLMWTVILKRIVMIKTVKVDIDRKNATDVAITYVYCDDVDDAEESVETVIVESIMMMKG